MTNGKVGHSPGTDFINSPGANSQPERVRKRLRCKFRPGGAEILDLGVVSVIRMAGPICPVRTTIRLGILERWNKYPEGDFEPDWKRSPIGLLNPGRSGFALDAIGFLTASYPPARLSAFEAMVRKSGRRPGKWFRSPKCRDAL